jgi:hypothetical protein
MNDACNIDGIPSGYWPWSVPTSCGNATGSCMGCSGGFKMWATDQTTVLDNYIHDNRAIGAWWDTDNTGGDFENNYVAHNYGEGAMWEISFDVKMLHNTFVDNAWGKGECGGTCDVGGNLAPAIYLSEADGSPYAEGQAGFSGVTVESNTFTDNWDGVSIYQNGNRMCGAQLATSTGWCPIGPTVQDNPTALGTYKADWNGSSPAPSQTYYANEATTNTGSGCGVHNLNGAQPAPAAQNAGAPDYYDNCAWWAQNITVADNQFSFNPSNITPVGTSSTPCTDPPSNGEAYCGKNGIMSSGAEQYLAGGTLLNPYYATPGGSPGYLVIDRLVNCKGPWTYTNCQPDNVWFSNNTYTHSGSMPWGFMLGILATNVSQGTWTGTDGQDPGSTFS